MNKYTLKLLALTVATTVAIADTTPPAPAPNLDWLVGHWCGERNGDFIEEQWLATRGRMLLGLSRTIRGDETRNYEYMRIEIQKGTITFVAQPNGAPPTPFTLAASGKDWARFENPAHDFPKRVEYRRTAQGLHAEIAGPGDGDRETVIPFEYAACGK